MSCRRFLNRLWPERAYSIDTLEQCITLSENRSGRSIGPGFGPDVDDTKVGPLSLVGILLRRGPCKVAFTVLNESMKRVDVDANRK